MKRAKREAAKPTSEAAIGSEPAGDRWRPWLLGALAALWVARPLDASESAVAGDGLPVVMLWIALAVVWLLGTMVRRSWTLRFGWPDAAVALLVGLYALSGLWAVFHGSPRPAINMLWEWVGFGLAFFMARQLIAGPKETRAVMAVMAALAVALAGYGLYQYACEMPATRAEYHANPDQALRNAGLWYPPGSRERWLFEQRLASPEPLATFALTNSLAAFLAPWLIVAMGIAWHQSFPTAPMLPAAGNDTSPTRQRGPQPSPSLALRAGVDGLVSGRERYVAMALAMPIAACLVLTKSRSSLIAAGVGLVLLYLANRGWRRREKVTDTSCRDQPSVGARPPGASHKRCLSPFPAGWRLPVAVGSAMLVALAIVVAAGGASRMLGLATKSLGVRLQYWQSSLAMIADHPWLGVGPGQFQNAYTAYMLPTASEEVADPHNFLVEIWATAGTPALAAVLALLVAFGVTVVRAEPSGGGTEGGSVGNALGGVPRTGNDLFPLASERHRGRSLQAQAGQDDRPWLVYLGAGCGFLLAFPLGFISGATPHYVVLWLGLPLAAVAMALLHRWVVAGPLSPMLPAIGASAMLVNLLGAGGIATAGVAGTLWLLMAVGLNMVGCGERLAPRPVGLILLVLASLLGVACYQTAYAPVLQSQAEIHMADRDDMTPPARQAHLLAAASADRLSAQPWRQLAALAMLRWQQEPSDVGYAVYARCRQEAARLDPNSAPMWTRFGDDELAAHEQQPRPDRLQMAIKSYHRAVDLYPNSATGRAKLALAYQKAGDRQAFRQQRDRAIELDRLTPHADKKLPEELRRRLLRN
jgi:O-antigen ligase